MANRPIFSNRSRSLPYQAAFPAATTAIYYSSGIVASPQSPNALVLILTAKRDGSKQFG
jgi:hypothetical protein